jgi:hypothetical protein
MRVKIKLKEEIRGSEKRWRMTVTVKGLPETFKGSCYRVSDGESIQRSYHLTQRSKESKGYIGPFNSEFFMKRGVETYISDWAVDREYAKRIATKLMNAMEELQKEIRAGKHT